MNNIVIEIRALLANAFSDRSPDWQANHLRNNLPCSDEAVRIWSIKMGRPVSLFSSRPSALWGSSGEPLFYCPRWLIIERSRKARLIRRELQRMHGDTMRLFLQNEASINRTHSECINPNGSLTRLIRSCALSPGETISRTISVIPLHRFEGDERVTKTYKPFGYNNCIGLEFETYGSIKRDTLAESLPYWTRVVSDGSIRPTGQEADGHEVRALLDRTKAEPRIFRLCERMQQLGLRVNRTCGLHIHLDARSVSSFDEVVRIGRIMDAWLYALRELLPTSRRANDYCKFGIAATDRYRAVNVSSYGKHRTLEIRCHSATLDYTKVIAWLRLCELIRAMPKKPKAASCIATLEQLPLATHDLSYWRARHRELNPSLYSANPVDTTTDSE